MIERLAPKRVLIVAPLTNLESTWETKLAELVPHIPVVTLPGGGRKAAAASALAFEAGVLLLHFEAFCSLAKQLRKRDWDLIIIDEGQRAKDRASLFSRRLAFFRHSIGYRLLLTGTPIERDPQDIWAQMRFVAYWVLGDRWKDFDQEYMKQPPVIDFGKLRRGSVRMRNAIMRQRIMRKKLGFDFDKFDDFIEKLKQYCWREELPGPEPIFHRIRVELYGEQRRVYQELDARGLVRLKDGTRIMPPVEIAKRIKLRQLTSGFLYDEDKVVHWVGRAKERELYSLLRRLGKQPLPIFCLYVPEIERLKDTLPGRVACLYGKTPREDRAKVQKAFQDGRLDYLVCQTRTGGVGIDLWRAKKMVVLSANYSTIDFDQLISRIRLPDQEEAVEVFLITVRGTIDEERQADVFGKSRSLSKVLKQLRR